MTGATDFDGDGVTDLLWLRSTTGMPKAVEVVRRDAGLLGTPPYPACSYPLPSNPP